MSRLTKAARGRNCTIRLPGCLGTVETTVAAHYRSIRLGAGIAHKNSDLLTAHACAHCHDIVDGRDRIKHGPSRDQVRLAHAEGVMETILGRFERGEIRLP